MPKLDPSLLQAIPAFRALDSAQLKHILSLATPKRFDNGEEVFSEGMDAERFFLLLDGHIRVIRRNPDGEEVIVLHIHSGGLFGIAKALGRTTYPATAQAAGEIIVLSWPMSCWLDFSEDYPAFASSTYQTVGKRVEEMNSRIMELATQQVEQRIACALVRMVEQSGKKTSAGIEVGFPITRQNIADMTGSTLHTVSRLLSAWDKSDVISSGRRQITVKDPIFLAKLANASG